MGDKAVGVLILCGILCFGLVYVWLFRLFLSVLP